jgi:sec-independent protein translocase protein TatA
MPNIGPLELVIILLVVLLLFGAKRLPELGRSLGSGMKEFKESVTGKESDSGRTELESGDDAPQPADAATRADAPVEAEPRS